MMRKNPRPIQLDVPSIAEMTSEFAAYLSKESTYRISQVTKKQAEVPLGAYLDWDWFAYFEKKFQYTDPKRNRTFEVVLAATPLKIKLKPGEDIRDVRCKDDILGAGLYVPSDVHKATSQRIRISLCPKLTLIDLQSAGESTSFWDSLFEVLIHELTHASEFGVAKGYVSADADVSGYLNHPWEVRANARQVGTDLVNEFRKLKRKGQLDLDDGENLSDTIDWALYDNSRYNRMMEHLTPKNQKKFLQILVSMLREAGFV